MDGSLRLGNLIGWRGRKCRGQVRTDNAGREKKKIKIKKIILHMSPTFDACQ